MKKEQLSLLLNKVNHGLRGITQRLVLISVYNLPKEVLEEQLSLLHLKCEEIVQLINSIQIQEEEDERSDERP